MLSSTVGRVFCVKKVEFSTPARNLC